MPSQEVKCVGLAERIGLDEGVFTHEKGGQKTSANIAIPNHEVALDLVAEALLNSDYGVISSVDEVDAVGHRVVHGGSKFKETTLVNEGVKEYIKELFDLAPLHNPANLTGIEVAEKVFPKAKQIAVFDTSFFQSIPQEVYQYAIPNNLLEDHKIRAYGFHGTSHKYVSEKTRELLGEENSTRIITVHLGNGCSITAIKDGKAVEHSLGFGPVNGLVMGTRSGDIDQSVVFYLYNKLGMSMKEINHLLQKESGMVGLTGYSDLRDIESEAENGNQDCINALKIATHRIKKYIGSYIATLNGVDVIVFTAGIGENSDTIRRMSCDGLDSLGIVLDQEKNAIRSKENREIQSSESKVKVMVVTTNEEIEIAKQSFGLIS